MEKLVLKGVMWGADKVPDEWFDKIPGGYYKAKQQKVERELEEKEQEEEKKNSDMKKRRSRRYSDDEYEEDDRDSRDDRETGYRSEGHYGRRPDGRKSHDRADDYDEINNRPRRKRSRARRKDDDDRYGKDDGHRHSSRRSRAGEVEYGDGAVPPADRPPSSVSYTDPITGAAAMGGAAAAAQAFQRNGAFGSPLPTNGAFGSPQPFSPQPNLAGSINSLGQDANQPPARSTSTLRGGMSTGYVPYAHIYGGPTHPASQAGFPPPHSDIGSVQPTFMNQVAAPKVAPPPGQYQQNPYAQEAAPGSQPGYIPDPNQQSNGRYDKRPDGRSRSRRDEYDSDETARDSRLERTRSRRSRRDRTPSEESYSDDSYDDRDRRRRSRRPPRIEAPPATVPRTRERYVDPRATSHHHGRERSENRRPPPPPSTSRRKEENREKEYHLRKAGYYAG